MIPIAIGLLGLGLGLGLDNYSLVFCITKLAAAAPMGHVLSQAA